jgi:hypothetical protein
LFLERPDLEIVGRRFEAVYRTSLAPDPCPLTEEKAKRDEDLEWRYLGYAVSLAMAESNLQNLQSAKGRTSSKFTGNWPMSLSLPVTLVTQFEKNGRHLAKEFIFQVSYTGLHRNPLHSTYKRLHSLPHSSKHLDTATVTFYVLTQRAKSGKLETTTRLVGATIYFVLMSRTL